MRQQAQAFVQPLWAVAGWPGAVDRFASATTPARRSQLIAENRRLRNELLVDSARMARLQRRRRRQRAPARLLGACSAASLDVQLAPILDIDLDPTRQRLVLDAGSSDGVRVGQVVIDAGGVLGQVIEVTPMHSTALLLTDPDHAVPVRCCATACAWSPTAPAAAIASRWRAFRCRAT